MSVRILIGLLLSMAWAPVCAGDLGPIGSAFESYNKAAARMGSNSRMVLKSCSADKARVCTYSLTGGLAAMFSTSTSNHGRAKDGVILFGKGSEPESFLEAVGLSMVAWSPRTDRSERSQALHELTNAVVNKTKTDVTLGSTTYTINTLENAGIWFSFEQK